MIRSCLIALFFFFINSSAALAQQLTIYEVPIIKPGLPGHNPGDIIAPVNDAQIAAWCDFNRQIVVTRTNVLCVYVGIRTNYTPPPFNLGPAPPTPSQPKSPGVNAS